MIPQPFSFATPPKIETERLILQALTSEHISEYHKLCSEEITMKAYGLKPHSSIEDTQKTLDLLEAWFTASTSIRWGIFYKSSGELIGDIGYWQFDVLRNRGELGAKISFNFKSKGLGYEATKAIIDFGFTTLKLNGIDANVSLKNKASLAMTKKLHFQQIGIRPELSYSISEQSFQDMVLLSLNRKHWEKRNSIVIVVDAFSSGNQLAPILLKHGFKVLHVCSMEDVSDALMATYKPEHFSKEYTYSGSINSLLDSMGNVKISAVLVGTETAVELTDQIAHKLNLPGNSPDSSKDRYNKFQMIEALREANVAVTEQIKSTDVAKILEWKDSQKFAKIIVKPLESAGSDGVFCCSSKEQIISAFNKIINQSNQMGGKNLEVLAQNYLQGPEYYVNTISCAKKHFICEIWRYHKRYLNERDFVYDYNEYIPLDQEDSSLLELTKYTYSVLDALDFLYGPSHAEIKLTPNGPRLIEIGARLQGMAAFEINAKTMGFTPAELSIDSYLFPAEFHKKINNVDFQHMCARRVFLTSYVCGRLKSINYQGEIEKLPSCIYLRWIKQPGDFLKPTVDYFSIPAIAVLAHQNPEQIEKDYRFIREFEKDNLFTLEEN